MSLVADMQAAVKLAVKAAVKLAVDGAVARLERVPDDVASEESFDPEKSVYTNVSYDVDKLHFSDEDEDQYLHRF